MPISLSRKPKNPRINFSHPLAKGLQFDFVLGEGGGIVARDLVTRSTLSVTNADWTSQYGDYGLRFDASGEYARTTSAPPLWKLKSHGRMTACVEFTRDSGGSGTNYGTLVGTGQGTAFGDRVWLFENDNGDSGWGQTFQIWWNSQPGIWSIPYPAAGVRHRLVVIYDGSSTSNNPVIILDGVLQSVTRRLDPAGSLRTNITTLALGNSAEAGGTWDGNVYRLRQYDRLLTIKEAFEFCRNPDAIYEKTTIKGKAAAGALLTKMLTETVTLVDALIKTESRILTETITPVDQVAKTTQRSLVESLTIVDALIRTSSRLFTEEISATDTLVKTPSRTITESITVADTFLREFTRVLSETITLVDSIIVGVSYTKTLSEIVTLTDTLVKNITRSLVESVTVNDSTIKSTSLTLEETLVLADSYLGGLARSTTLTEVVTITDLFTNIVNAGVDARTLFYKKEVGKIEWSNKVANRTLWSN